jgi:hypothetical protein
MWRPNGNAEDLMDDLDRALKQFNRMRHRRGTRRVQFGVLRRQPFGHDVRIREVRRQLGRSQTRSRAAELRGQHG